MGVNVTTYRSLQYTTLNRNGKREEEEVLPFWKTEVIYQVYPRSFLDGIPDGIGDLKGQSEHTHKGREKAYRHKGGGKKTVQGHKDFIP